MKRTGIDVVDIALGYLMPHDFSVAKALDEYDMEVALSQARAKPLNDGTYNKQFIPVISLEASQAGSSRNSQYFDVPKPVSMPSYHSRLPSEDKPVSGSPFQTKRIPPRTKTAIALQQLLMSQNEGVFAVHTCMLIYGRYLWL